MTETSSVSAWIQDLKVGDSEAARQLWERYFHRLVHLARKRLPGGRLPAVDEEDVALSVFNALCEGATDDRFPRLHDRDDLWKTLVWLTGRKAVDKWRRENAAKRGGAAADVREALTIEDVVDREPDPAFAAMFAEHVRIMMEKLPSDELREIAQLRLQGFSQEEIVQQLDSSPRTIRRRIALIRECWETAETGSL